MFKKEELFYLSTPGKVFLKGQESMVDSSNGSDLSEETVFFPKGELYL